MMFCATVAAVVEKMQLILQDWSARGVDWNVAFPLDSDIH
jgi:hypothetical protein